MISLLDESNDFTTSHCGFAPEIPDTGLLLSLEEEIKYYQGLPHIYLSTQTLTYLHGGGKGSQISQGV